MTTADILHAIAPGLPIFAVAVLIFIQARKRWKTRFQRGNGRPEVPCSICGQKYQRGLPLQWHMDQAHAPKGKKR